jgi:hypothetical protein
MKTQFKNPINNLAPIFLVLMSMFVLGFGCNTSNTSDTSKPIPDPLAGWKMDFGQPDSTITKDYQDYIQKLPSEEKRSARANGYYENGTGQHAVQIEVALNGTWWNHVLIYDKTNKRIKVIKYSPGKYRS